MKRKTEKFIEKYVCSRPESELKQMQRLRLIYLLGALVLFTVTLFIKQSALTKLVDSEHKFATTIQTLYVFLVLLTLLTAIYALICSFTRYKIASEILAKNAPKKGFSEGTWTAFILPIVLVVLYLILIVGLIIYKFSVGSLVTALLSIGAGVLFYLAMDVGKKAYRDTTTLLSEKDVIEELVKAPTEDGADSPEDFYEE